jgi:hypothetical protein
MRGKGVEEEPDRSVPADEGRASCIGDGERNRFKGAFSLMMPLDREIVDAAGEEERVGGEDRGSRKMMMRRPAVDVLRDASAES